MLKSVGFHLKTLFSAQEFLKANLQEGFLVASFSM